VTITEAPEVAEVRNPEDAPFASNLSERAIQEFQSNAVGVACRFRWVTQQRVVDKRIKAEVAEQYEAEEDAFGLFCRLWPTENTYVSELRAARSAIAEYWKTRTLTYVEKGVRILHRERLEGFWAGLRPLVANLQQAAKNFKANLHNIIAQAEEKLGARFFKRENYPLSAESVTVEAVLKPVPVIPPNYLVAYAPGVYADAQAQFQRDMRQAALVWERELAQQLGNLVNHLVTMLTPTADGEQRVLHTSAVEHLRTFFGEFRQLQMSGDTQLTNIVNRAESVLAGTTVDDLREVAQFRQQVAGQLSELRNTIAENYMVDVSRRRRNIIRQPAE
jgi:ElaB/YqjD/DUF883 family membrane-anchored ribosome-binding protein